MIPEYISRKLSEFCTALDSRDQTDALYALASHGKVLPQPRLREISERYGFTDDEAQAIVSWATAILAQ